MPTAIKAIISIVAKIESAFLAISIPYNSVKGESVELTVMYKKAAA